MTDESNVIDNKTKKYLRFGCSEQRELEQFMSKSYGVSHSLITTSGMHANTASIITAHMQNKWQKICIVYSNEMYCDTSRFIENYKKMYGNVDIWSFSVEDTAYLKDIFTRTRGDSHILFVESLSNPNSRLFDFEIISQLRKLSSNLTVIVDNTWITHLGLNPFNYDVDIVTTSLTKYYSAGTEIAGAMMFRSKDLYDISSKRMVYEGYHISPVVYRHLLDKVSTIYERVNVSSMKTILVVNELRNKIKNNTAKFIEVNHPNLTNKNVIKYLKMNIYPSVFTVKIKCDLNKFKLVMKEVVKQNILPLITSFGSEHTKLDPYPLEINNEYVIFRVAIGYRSDESIEYIVRSVEQVVDLAVD